MVAAPGGYAETVAVPARNVHPLPARHAARMGRAGRAARRSARTARGSPTRGPATTCSSSAAASSASAPALAARAGVRATASSCSSRSPERRELCARLGLQALHPDDVLGGDRAFDVAIDCVARPETLHGAVRAVPPQGLVVLVGIWEDEIPLPVSLVVGGETRIAGSYGYNHEDFADVAAWIGTGEVDLSPIIEHRVGFDGVIDAFDALRRRVARRGPDPLRAAR